MEGIINSLRNLFNNYGFTQGLIIVAVIVITNLIKKPIVKFAIKKAEQTGLDKSVITKHITLIPFGVSFILVLVVALFAANWKFPAIDFGQITSESTIIAAVSIATYEGLKKQLESYASRVNKKQLEEQKLDEQLDKEEPSNG